MKVNLKSIYPFVFVQLFCAFHFISFAQDALFYTPDSIQCAKVDNSAVLFSLEAKNKTYTSYEWIITGPSSYNKTYSGDNNFSSVSIPLSTIGSYNVTLIVNGNKEITDTKELKIIEFPTILLEGNMSVCQNSLTNYSLSISTSYDSVYTKIQSSLYKLYNNSSFSHDFSSTPPGGQQISITVFNDVCSFTKSENVIVLQNPRLTSALNPTSICSQTSFKYLPTTNPSSNVTYTWERQPNANMSTPNSFGSSEINEVLTNTSESPTMVEYKFDLIDTSNKCEATQNISVAVLPKPIVTVTPSSPSVCANTEVILNARASYFKPINLSWSPKFDNTNPEVKVKPSTTSTYTVKVSSITTPVCSDSASVTVNVVSPPKYTGPKSDTVCSRSILSIPLSSNVTGSTFSWYTLPNPLVGNITDNEKFSSKTDFINNAPINLSSKPQKLNYKVKVALGNCPSDSVSDVYVIVNPKPENSFETSKEDFCSPDPSNMLKINNKTTLADSTIWTFYTESKKITFQEKKDSFDIGPFVETGQWSINMESSNSFGCTDKDIFTNFITVGPEGSETPSGSISGPIETSVCTGLPVCLNYSALTQTDTVVWSFGDGTLNELPPAETACHTYLVAGRYTITATPYKVFNVNGKMVKICGGTPMSISVTINGLSNASITDSIINCNDQRDRYFSCKGCGDGEYSWFFGDGSDTVRDSAPRHAFLKYSGTDCKLGVDSSFNVTLNFSQGKCTSKLIRKVNVFPNDSAIFNTYKTFNNCTPCPNTFQGECPDNNSCESVDTNEACIGERLYLINETPLPQFGSPCKSPTLNSSMFSIWTVYTVPESQTSIAPDSIFYLRVRTGSIQYINLNKSVFQTPGLYKIRLENIKQNKNSDNKVLCSSSTYGYKEIKIHGIIGELSLKNANPLNHYCFEDTICFIDDMKAPLSDSSASQPNGIISRTWDFGDGSPIISSGNQVTVYHKYLRPGKYVVTLTDSSAYGCAKTSTKSITIVKPESSFDLNQDFICKDQTVETSNNSVGSSALSFDWEVIPKNPSSRWAFETNFSNTSRDTKIKIMDEDSLSIRLIVEDAVGCKDTSFKLISVFNPVIDVLDPGTIECFSVNNVVQIVNNSYNNVDQTSAKWIFKNNNTAGFPPSITSSSNWNPKVQFIQAGNYDIILKELSSKSGCFVGPDTVKVYVGGPEGFMSSKNSTTGCQSLNVDFEMYTRNVSKALFFPLGVDRVVSIDIADNQAVNTSFNYENNTSSTLTYLPAIYISNGPCSGFIYLKDSVKVYPKPKVEDQFLSAVCSDASAGVSFGSSISGSVATATYNVTALNSGGLSFSGGGAADGTGLSPTALEDDAFSNLTANQVNVVYTVVPVSSNSCQGDPFTVTLPVNPEPLLSNQTISGVCSDIALGVPFNSSTGVTASRYNVTGLDTNGLKVSGGGPIIGTGFSANDLADDSFTNTTNSPVNVVYTAVPVSSNGCKGNPFSVTVTVNPEPVVENQTKTVCSDVATALTLNGAKNGVSIGSYTITEWNSNNMPSSAGAPSTGPGLPSTVISNHAWTNTTSSSKNVVYTVVPIAQSTACSGNAFTAIISVIPEPVVSTQNLSAVCSDASAGVSFGSSISGSVATATYNVTALNSGGLSFSGGGAADGTGLSPTALEDDAFSNLTANQVNVVYTVVPVSSNSCQGDPFTVTLPVNPEPLLSNQTISGVCSDIALGVPFNSSTGVTSSRYNVTGLDTNGLKVSGGGPIIGTGFSATDLADDSFTNTTNSPVNVVYTVVPVSSNGCEGNPFKVTVTVNPEPVVENQTKTVCSDVASAVNLNGSTNSISIGSYSITNLNSNGMLSSAGAPSTGPGLPSTVISNHAWTNTTSSSKNVVYTVVPIAQSTACSGNAFTATIIVEPLPKFTLAPKDPTICNEKDGNINITNLNPNSNYQYSYEILGNLTKNNFVTSSIGDFLIDNLGSGTYNVIVTNSLNNCISESQSVELINPQAPNIEDIKDVVICDGSYTLPEIKGSDLSGASILGYYPTLIPNGSGTDQIPKGTLLTKSQTVYIYASTAGGCLDQESFVVTINQSPTANNQSLLVCSDQQLKLKLPGSSNESPILSYNITNINSNGLISSLGSPNLGNGFKDDEIFNDAWSNQGVEAKDIVYTIKPVGNGNCSNNSFTVSISVNPEPVVSTQNLLAVCSDASAGVPFGSSISGSVAAATYNVTALNSGGLSFSGGGAADGTGLSATALVDDAFSNLTANKVNVNYTVVPVSSNSCQGDPFTVTLPVNPEPAVSNQTISGICSDVALGLSFNSSTRVTASRYNVTGLDTNGLKVSGGGPIIGTEFSATDLADDSFTNTTNSPVNVVYTVVPVSSNGCEGNPFTVTVSVNPEPVVENQTKTVCSDVATAVNLNGSTNGISIKSYSITNLNSNSMLSSAGAPSTGSGLPSTVISNHAWTNTTSSSKNVVYTVVPIAQSTACSGNAFTATISVNPKPVVSNQNLLAVCSDALAGVPFGSSISGSVTAATYNVTALNSGGLSFSGGGAADGTGLSPTALEDDAFSNLTTNQVNVVYTVVPVSSNSCQGDPFTVTLPVNPEPVIDNQIISLCSFSSVGIPFSASKSVPSINYNVVGLNLNGLKVLSGNPSIATDLKMLDLADDAFENTSISVLNAVYNVVPVSEKGCRGDSKTTTISVSPAIYLDTTKLTKFYEYCSGDQVNIQFTGTVNKYSWTSSNSKTGISSGSGQGLNYKTTNTSDKNQLTTIRVSANLGNCVGKNFDFNITVKPIPNVVINPRRKMTYCSGDSSDYIDFRGLYSDSTLFIWRQTNTSIWNEKLPISDTSDISKHLLQNIQMSNPLTSQVDSIFVLPKLNGCSGIEDTLIISVKPETSIRVNDFKVCSNEKVAETCFSSLVSGVDFDWRFGNLGIGMPSFSGKGCIPSWISSNSGKANVVVTPIIQNCRGKSDTLTIDVLPLPKINPVTDYAFCHDESTGDIKFNSNIESKIFWRNIGPSIGSLSSGINYIPSFIASNELTIPIEGIFEIYGSNTTSGITCIGDTTELLIIVNPLPKVNAGNDTLLCKTQCLKLNATGESINPPLIFSWDKSGIQGKPFCVNNSIILTVTGTDQNLCKNSDEIEINYIDINPPLVNAGPDDAICRGESYTLNAIVGLDVVFSWNNGVINSTPFKPELSKDYILKAIDPKTGCINRDTVEIVVNPLPNVKIATPDAIVCEGETVTLTASGALNFEWKNGNKDSVYTMSPAVGGTYEVIGTDVNGCSNSADTLVVVNPLPIPMFSSNMKNGGCLPFCPKLYDETGKNQNGPIGSTIAWNFGNNTTSNQLDSTVVCFDDYGCYDVTLIATTSEGCSASLIQKDFFCVKEIIADFATDPASATQSVYSPLFNFTNKTSNASTYKWYFGDNGFSSPQSIISDPSYTYSFGGFFMVRLVASTDDGCSDTIQKQITVLDDLIMNIPNAFTPNGDDLNDEFIPILTSGFDRNSGYLLNIYNRWGEIIYTSEQIGEGWDGTIESQPAPIGTYNWVLQLKDSMTNKILTFNGYVSLIR